MCVCVCAKSVRRTDREDVIQRFKPWCLQRDAAAFTVTFTMKSSERIKNHGERSQCVVESPQGGEKLMKQYNCHCAGVDCWFITCVRSDFHRQAKQIE